MTDFDFGKISQFSPVPGKPVRKSFNKNLLHQAKHSPIVLPRHGGVAQLGERLTGSQEVRGSIPLVSTIVNIKAFGFPKAFFHAKISRATNPYPHQQKVAQFISHVCTKFVIQTQLPVQLAAPVGLQERSQLLPAPQ